MSQVLSEIHESAERLQGVIQDLLLLWELRASKDKKAEEKCLETVAVNESMLALFNFWIPVAKQKAIQYQFRPAHGAPQVSVRTTEAATHRLEFDRECAA